MAKATGKAKDALDSGWGGRELVYCEDGPRAGAWYFLTEGESSWVELRRLAAFNNETTRQGRTLGYVTTPREVEHRINCCTGKVLVWAPDVAAKKVHPQAPKC